MKWKAKAATAGLAILIGVAWGFGLIDGEVAAQLGSVLGGGAIVKIAHDQVKKRRAPLVLCMMLGGSLLMAQPASAFELIEWEWPPQASLFDILNIGFDEISIGFDGVAGIGIRRTPDHFFRIDAEPTFVDGLIGTCKIPWIKDRVTFACAIDEFAGMGAGASEGGSE